MAANFTPVKKPQTYEISPKWIIIYQAINLILGIAAAVLSYILKDPRCFLIYSFVLFWILFVQICEYSTHIYLGDVSSEIFHPDLMSKNDFISLRKRYSKLLLKKFDYKEDGKPFPEKYKMLLDNLETRYLSQSDLRRRCWFTKMVGVAIVDKSNVEEPFPSFITSGADPTVDEKQQKPDSYNFENDSESDAFSTNDNDSDSELVFYGESDVSVMIENNANTDDIRMTKFDEKISVMQNEIDQLKVHFAEMKAENTKLKNFIETFITAQAFA